jgi:hypothetical protein
MRTAPRAHGASGQAQQRSGAAIAVLARAPRGLLLHAGSGAPAKPRPANRGHPPLDHAPTPPLRRYAVRLALVDLDAPPAWFRALQAADHMTADEARAFAGTDGGAGPGPGPGV